MKKVYYVISVLISEHRPVAPVTANATPTCRTAAARTPAMAAYGGACFPTHDTTVVDRGLSTAARDKPET